MNKDEIGLLTPTSAKVGPSNDTASNESKGVPGFDRSSIMLKTNEFLQKIEDNFYGAHTVSAALMGQQA
jgi:hypothetical protein